MAKGRKKIPTRLKAMQGTTEKSREPKNEMVVALCPEIPDAPGLLSEIGKGEWVKVTTQLFNLQMLHGVDLRLVEAYCNEISLYIESETDLRENGRIDKIYGTTDSGQKYLIRSQTNPAQKIAKDALAMALKLATQFGLTPVARASISTPIINNNTLIQNFLD